MLYNLYIHYVIQSSQHPDLVSTLIECLTDNQQCLVSGDTAVKQAETCAFMGLTF